MGATVLDCPRAASSEAELVGLLPVALHPDVRRVAADLAVKLELSDAAGLVVARIASRCPEIVLVDSDLLGCPEALCRLSRSRRPDVTFVVLSCFWSDREEMLRACADAVVHKPVRDGEWRDLFGRLNVTDTAIHAALQRPPHLAA